MENIKKISTLKKNLCARFWEKCRTDFYEICTKTTSYSCRGRKGVFSESIEISDQKVKNSKWTFMFFSMSKLFVYIWVGDNRWLLTHGTCIRTPYWISIWMFNPFWKIQFTRQAQAGTLHMTSSKLCFVCSKYGLFHKRRAPHEKHKVFNDYWVSWTNPVKCMNMGILYEGSVFHEYIHICAARSRWVSAAYVCMYECNIYTKYWTWILYSLNYMVKDILTAQFANKLSLEECRQWRSMT